jgi:hypothetical protein
MVGCRVWRENYPAVNISEDEEGTIWNLLFLGFKKEDIKYKNR